MKLAIKKRDKDLPKKVLILGSGGLRIGQAGEFDYSGSQAIKALKEEGIRVVLVNPNIATIQTDESMADELYLEPLTIDRVEKIIIKEKPNGILLGFGGQTALNLGLELHAKGILAREHVAVLGTPIRAIHITEDRKLFTETLAKINVKTPRSIAATTVAGAISAGEKIGYPLMMRAGYSLGGLGSGVITSPVELEHKAKEALHGAPQILIEEYLEGWKEVEYEIVRDAADNAITVCNMENMDPMGIHTGESIVVAPSQTLTNDEYHSLRNIALTTARHIGIIGECNIQYALHPKTGDYRVIEINARLSRSSALASKATGYPLAFVAAKLALGYRLDELKNSVTGSTSAFFEPALDYLAVKIPRWDTHKLKAADRRIGSEMKSVGEVMAIGRSFPEAIQKGIRMLSLGASGITDYPIPIEHPEYDIATPTDRRLFALYEYFQRGKSVNDAHALSHIDPWFLYHIKCITKVEKRLKKESLTPELLRTAKQYGFSDRAVGSKKGMTEDEIRAFRKKYHITPVIKQIDTLAGEFPARTNYLYTTYHGTAHDIQKSKMRPIVVLGSGPYAIGSSVEFDWCAVNTARTLRAVNHPVIIINSNPETVSTDYDESDRLYFEELTLERILDIIDREKPKGVIVSMGGQIPNTLAMPLASHGCHILGTDPTDIDRAENRQTFGRLLKTLDIDQPAWEEVTTIEKAKRFAKRVGYPILIRPSYVLSGAAMNVVYEEGAMKQYLKEAALVSPHHPVVMSQFITDAKEFEIDGVAKNGVPIVTAITEHIENAGVHSGDATIVLPPQKLYLETVRQAKQTVKKIVSALRVTGPFNIQFLAKDNQLKVIECNLRASRSFPFVSKVTRCNFIDIATRAIVERRPPLALAPLVSSPPIRGRRSIPSPTEDLNYVGVKTPQFSYARLKGADPVARVEMASTGEVACIGRSFLEAFWNSWRATEQHMDGKRLLISVGDVVKKARFVEAIRTLEQSGWTIYATEGTHDFLSNHGIGSVCLFKMSDGLEPNIETIIEEKSVDLVINIPRSAPNQKNQTEGYKIRRLAIDHRIPLITNMEHADVFLKCLTELDPSDIPVMSWREYT